MSFHTQLAGLSGRAILLCSVTGEAYVRALAAKSEAPSAGAGGLPAMIARLFAGERRSSETPPQPPAADLDGKGVDPAQLLRSHALFAMPPTASDWEYEWGYRLLDGCVALIDIDGLLIANDAVVETPGGWLDYLIGYDGLEGAVLRAAADQRVKVIGLRIKAPGGDASGVFDLAETIRSVSARAGGKPVHVYIGAMALSAGYMIACAADHITASAEALVGSIGAVILHIDTSRAMEKAGITITPITFPDPHKTAEAGIEPLTDAGRAQMQTRIDEIGRRFVAFVAAQRGLEESAVLELKAGFVLARHSDASASGLDLGLVDDIASQGAWYDRLLALAEGEAEAPAAPADPPSTQAAAADAATARPAAAFAASGANPPSSTNQGEPDMDAAKIAAMKAKMEGEGKSADEILAAIVALINGDEDDDGAGGADAAGDGDEPDGGQAAAQPAAANAGKSVGEQILDLPEAEGRDRMAARLAVTPGMTVETAKGLLASAPKASAAPGFPGEVPDPQVTPDGKGGGANAGGDIVAQAKALANAGGLGYRLRDRQSAA